MIPCPHGLNPDVCGYCWRERGQKAEARLRELEAQAEITRLREALRPFAEYAATFREWHPDSTLVNSVITDDSHIIRPITLADCRRARQALEARNQ